jgi:hypothetical protein
MKLFTFTIFLLGSFLSVVLATDFLSQKQHLWKERVLLIFSPDDKTSEYKEQMDILERHAYGLKERDLVVYSIFENTGRGPGLKKLNTHEVEVIRNNHNVNVKKFAVVLIGKDGTEKLRRKSPISEKKLFNTIDAMPMRQSETNVNANASN